MPQPAAVWPSACNVLRQRLTIFSSEYYHLPGINYYPFTYPEGWKAELAWGWTRCWVCNFNSMTLQCIAYIVLMCH